MKKVLSVFGTVVYCSLIGLCVLVILTMLISFVTTHEVETYEFDATVTAKTVIDEYRRTREHLLYWVNGDESGEVNADVSDYARYAVGDLVPIKAVVKEDIFGNLRAFYKIGA